MSTRMFCHAKTGRLQFVQHTSGKFSPRRKTKQVRGYQIKPIISCLAQNKDTPRFAAEKVSDFGQTRGSFPQVHSAQFHPAMRRPR